MAFTKPWVAHDVGRPANKEDVFPHFAIGFFIYGVDIGSTNHIFFCLCVVSSPYLDMHDTLCEVACGVIPQKLPRRRGPVLYDHFRPFDSRLRVSAVTVARKVNKLGDFPLDA